MTYEVRLQEPPGRHRTKPSPVGDFTDILVGTAFQNPGEWVSADLPDGFLNRNINGSMHYAVSKRVAEIRIVGGAAYVRIKDGVHVVREGALGG